MVRRVGGTIFQSVPATSTALMASQAKGSTTPTPTKTPVQGRRNSFPAMLPLSGKVQDVSSNSAHGDKGIKSDHLHSSSSNLGRTGTWGLKKRNSSTTAAATATAAPSTPSSSSSLLSPLPQREGEESVTPSMILGAKPSEIREAARKQRDKVKLEQFRKDKIRKREAEAAVRMQKIKDEIDRIKAKEQQQNEEAVAQVQKERQESKILLSQVMPQQNNSQPPTPTGVEEEHEQSNIASQDSFDILNDIDPSADLGHDDSTSDDVGELPPPTVIPTRKRSTSLETIQVSKGAKELALEELMAERKSNTGEAAQDTTSDDDSVLRGQKALMGEMNESFSLVNMPMDELAHFRTTIKANLGAEEKNKAKTTKLPTMEEDTKGETNTQTTETATRTREYRKDVATQRGTRAAPNRKKMDRVPSNWVPEMRRRANQRDLLFDDDDNLRDASSSEFDDSRSSLDASKLLDANTTEPQIQQQHAQTIVVQLAVPKSTLPEMSLPQSQETSPVKPQDATLSQQAETQSLQPTSTPTETFLTRAQPQTETEPDPVAPKPSSFKAKANNLKGSSHEKTQKLEMSPWGGKSSMLAARQAKAAAKKEEEKAKKQAQKAELDKAKEHFDKGHDLCWKCNDSAGALVEYRKALFSRESILGKYHEETGRSYFWIGKSLTKLKEYDEALMAFSRSMRIFERVLKKSNKYNIWAMTAVESVFRQMDMTDVDFPTYKQSLEASIKNEQEGDQLRKKGKTDEAIASYRDAIDHLEEYHPDAADLYCKIAILLRQKGDFDRALEEYRFASEIYELSLGAEHPETVKTLNQLMSKKRLNQQTMALMEKLGQVN